MNNLPKKTKTSRLLEFFGSLRFFWLVVALLVIQAAWIALSGRYPMAFDEEFHLGIIQLYAEQWGPFMAAQPAGADSFGAVFRDPSYLYHYLMSFPYKLLGLFTDNTVAKVLILRGINIGLFAGGLVLFRRLMQKTGISLSIIHLALLVVVLLPVTPMLAAHINYDNLIILLTALALLLSVNFASKLSKNKPIDTGLLITLAAVCLGASLVKFSFLPVLVVIAAYVMFKLWQARGSSWQRLSLRSAVFLSSFLIVMSGLAFERYGLSLVHYGSPLPDCAKVLTVEQCSKSGVWIRNYNAKVKNVDRQTSPITYMDKWLYGMWLRTFFTLAGPDQGYQTRSPLPVPALGGIAFGIIGLGSLIIGLPKLLRKYNSSVIKLLLAVAAVYIAVLWLNGYNGYLQTRSFFGINGRYLLPIWPLLLPLAGAAASNLLGRHRNLKLILAGAPIICLLWGGGALTYILRSNSDWHWPNQTVQDANSAVQRALGPITPGYKHPTQFLR